MKIANDGERVLISIGSELCVLSVREAFDATTEILRAIEGARSYGAAIRGEVSNPDPRSDPYRQRRQGRRSANG